jgi:mRNA interferase MazF
VDFGTPQGSEPGYVHPAVVVQSDIFNAGRIGTIVVCATTTNLKRATDPGNVLLDLGEGGLPEQSVVNVSQIIAVDRSRFLERIGVLSQDRVRQILGGIHQLLEGEDLGL